MIYSPGIATQISATVDREDFQIGMAFEHAVEDEVVQGESSLQRIAHDIVEMKS